MDIKKGMTVRLKTLDLAQAKKHGDLIAKAMAVPNFEGVKKYVQEQLANIGIGKEGVITSVCNDRLAQVKFVGTADEFFVPVALLELTGGAVGRRLTLHHKLALRDTPGAFAPAGTRLEFIGAVIQDIGGGVQGLMNCYSILDGEFRGQTLHLIPGSSAEWSMKEG